MKQFTRVEKFCANEVKRLIADDTEWRSATVIVTYKLAVDGPREVRIGNAIGLKAKTPEQIEDAALDLVQLIKRLRSLADELEEMADGRRPLPEQPKDWG